MIEILNESGEWVTGTPTTEGQRYREVTPSGGKIEMVYSIPAVDDVTRYDLETTITLVGGIPAVTNDNTIFGEPNKIITFRGKIVDETGAVQTQIDQTALGWPPVLKIPVTKYVGGIRGTAVDEVYFNAEIHAGDVIVSGKVPASGDWKILTSRANKALAVINAGFELSSLHINILC